MKKRIIKKVGSLVLAIVFIIGMCISAFACKHSGEIGVSKEIEFYKSILLQQTVNCDGSAKSYNLKLVKELDIECVDMIYYNNGCGFKDPVTPIGEGKYDIKFIFKNALSIKFECKIECALIIIDNDTPTCPTTQPTTAPTTAPTTSPATTQAPTTAPTAAPVKTVVNTTVAPKAAAVKSNTLIADTGDNSTIYIYTILFSCSLAAIIAINYKRHKEKVLSVE